MDEELTELHDSTNRELKAMGYHLQLDNIYIDKDNFGFDFIEPVDQWFNELPEVDSLVTTRIREWLTKMERD